MLSRGWSMLKTDAEETLGELTDRPLNRPLKIGLRIGVL